LDRITRTLIADIGPAATGPDTPGAEIIDAAARAGRAASHAPAVTAEGEPVVSVVQEGLIRSTPRVI